MTTETKMQQFEGEFAALGPDAAEFYDTLEENTGSRQLPAGSLPVWKFPGSGNNRWVREDSSGVKHFEDSLVGVVLAQTTQRSMYLSGYDGGGEFPDCQSPDGITGYPHTDRDTNVVNNLAYAKDGSEIRFGGACESCPLNQWDSAAAIGKQGKGKACTEYRLGVMQRPDQPTPEGFRLPPTALKAWGNIGLEMARTGNRLSRTVLELSLVIPPNENLAQLNVRPLGFLPKDVADQLKAIAPDIKRPQLAAPTEPEYVPPPLGEEGDADPDDLPF